MNVERRRCSSNQEERPDISARTRACQENGATPVGYPGSTQTQHLPHGPAKVKVNAKNRVNRAQTLPPREHEPNPISPSSNRQQQSAIFSATDSVSVGETIFGLTMHHTVGAPAGDAYQRRLYISQCYNTLSFNCAVGLSAYPRVTSTSNSTDQKVGKLVQANQTQISGVQDTEFKIISRQL